jgi:hypothetical protein
MMPQAGNGGLATGAGIASYGRFCSMLTQDDNRWTGLTGGYRTSYDPRPMLARLETGQDTAEAWQELWEMLHHQGDVGESSYAAVPHLVRIYRQRALADWNTYAIVAVVELARTNHKNPKVPGWLEEDYFHAIKELAALGAAEIFHTEDPETTRAILSIIAIAKHLRGHGRFLLEYSEEELLEIESR